MKEIICSCCDYHIPEEDVIYIDNYCFCPECYEDYALCSCCDYFIERQNMYFISNKYICVDCLKDLLAE